MRNLKTWLLSAVGVGMVTVAGAHINPNIHHKPASSTSEISYRENCDNAIAQIDQAVNNVRARLTTGGDVWWDGDDGRYVVPKVAPGVPEVSSIFAGAVWLGGYDDGGNLKLAAQTYGRSTGKFDYWPGPLIPDGDNQGEIEKETCAKWDRFFTVSALDIDKHKAQFEQAKLAGIPYDEAEVPRDVRGWPAKGNPYFFDVHEFELPNTSQGLAGFHDYDGDGNYDPVQGDYPIIEIRGCPDIYYGDEMTFWIYNDSGNSHAESGAVLPLKMEVQVQTFAYSTSDEINNMTFQRYKLINRAITSIDSTYFAWWVDPDLGCHTDDYVGCDVERSLAYVYNEDAVDGTTGCNCDGGVNTYCEEVPILGVDYFRGPLDENGDELGMSSFTYYNNGSIGSPEGGTTDPDNDQQYYNYMSGTWKDGSPFQFGGNGWQQGTYDIDYAFVDPPNLEGGWSMSTQNLAFGDRRTVQASGPFRLDPGAVNELIVGAVWVADQAYPDPSIRKLQEADDIAQKLFDECFNIPNGPDAPDVDFIELDQEIIAVLTNNLPSNNINEEYAGTGLDIPASTEDSLYYFEGYRIFQVANSDTDLSAENREDPAKVRIVAEVDIKNGVGKLFNWKALDEEDRPTAEEFFIPEMQIEGQDEGIRHTFRITEDKFATGDDIRLINHKKYYYVAVAYAFNEYEPFDPVTQIGQKKPYFEGRKNIGPNQDGKPYTVIPRPTVDRKLNAGYGDGAVITRIDGVGTATNFLDLSDETRTAIENGFATATQVNELTYRPGRGPIDILVYNPLEVKDGEFELTFIDEDMGNDQLDNQTFWVLKNLSSPGTPEILSDTTIAKLNEQIVNEYGFSISIGQVADAGSEPLADPTNGYIGYEEEYAKGEEATTWLSGIADDYRPEITVIDEALFNFVKTNAGEPFDFLDPEQVYNKIGPGYFVPYYLCDWLGNEGFIEDILTPAWTNNSNGNKIVNDQTSLSEINNVDIVFTSNKDLWSRCVVIETANKWVTNGGVPTEGTNIVHFDLRGSPSVTKFDNDGDLLPDVDPDPEVAMGMGWFPGYAIDVETGERLNIFFGENSTYDGSLFGDAFDAAPTGRDMMFNPSSQLFLNTGVFGEPFSFNYYAGGQHYVYVTKQPYDGCLDFADRLEHSSSALKKVKAVKEITWAGLIMPVSGQEMLSYADGLIPEDVTVKLRANNPYEVKVGTGEYNGYPTYRFKLEGLQAEELDTDGVETALDLINVVPNPYYGFSDYEISQFTTTVKITNLPAKCTVTIYSLDGKFIRQYDRDELGGLPKGSAIGLKQVLPDIEWDLKNSKSIPIASGVYLIHVAAEGLGERTLKWFGVNRQFDPSGL